MLLAIGHVPVAANHLDVAALFHLLFKEEATVVVFGA